MQKQSVSFIIPYYNAGNTIKETVDSILNQDYTNFDIWIVNDGSTDMQSLAKLNEFESNTKITVLHQQNAGPSVARNNAIKQTDAKYIVPLDADDLIKRDTLSKAISILEKDTGIGVVYGNLRFFGSRDELKNQSLFDMQKQMLWNQIAVCSVIRKQIFDECGYFDEWLSKPGLEDWEFWIRVGQSHWKFKKIDEVLFEVSVNDSSRTYQVANKNIDAIKEYVYRKHAVLLASVYNEIYYEKKMLRETPDFRIGNFMLKPYRMLKRIIG
jgi:glycosyltransferase involved in cell wall biosynthesis